MTSEVRFCSKHSYFSGAICPDCSSKGDFVASEDDKLNLSKTLTWLLRHGALEAGLEISDEGWVSYNKVKSFLKKEKPEIDITDSVIYAIVYLDDKNRFQISEGKMRALYAHNIQKVEITEEASTVPEVLYHGTAPRFVSSIQQNGIKPQSRNNVCLTDTYSDAINVGKRHTNKDKVVVLTVDGKKLSQSSYTVQNPNSSIYTVGKVPPEYIKKYTPETV